MGPTSRVIILIDMDCFYCQVEEKLNPEIEGKPIAVVQYNAWRGGGIIAVNYPARDQGVTRDMRGNEAKKKCPSINLVQVPELRGKADLTKYRDAGQRVADVLATFTPLLQRASVDEAYLDITEAVEKRLETSLNDLTTNNLTNTYVVGCELKDFLYNVVVNKEFSSDNLKLAMGGLIAEEIRHEVFKKTGYKCSAGIAHNKILAKLVCSLHKPNKQTILPQDAVPEFFKTIKISKIKNLGGKFGQTLSEDFNITYMGELKNISEKELSKKYDEKTAYWLYNVARGIDMEPVTTKLISKSIACCKNFTGKAALTTSDSVEHWLNELSAEMSERLNKDLKENNRKAKQIIVSFCQEINKKDVSSTRTIPLPSYEVEKIASSAFNIVKKNCARSDDSYHIKFLGLNASNFENVRKVREITSFFQKGQIKEQELSNSNASNDNTMNKNEDIVFNDENNDKIYHQVTQELQENPEELIFYDDSNRVIHSEDHLYQELDMESNQHLIPDDSIPIQADLNEEDSIYDNDKPSSSFFSKYFKNSPQHSPVKNINNSLQLTEIFVEEEATEICSECQKNVPLSELVSHHDFHYAKKILENEKNVSSILPKSGHKTNVKSPKKGRSKGIKRKVENTGTLVTFLKKESEECDSDLTELCPECHKRIKIEEIENHKDYHTAKKIHQEINGLKPTNIVKLKTTKSRATKAKSQTPNRSVISFFKPT